MRLADAAITSATLDGKPARIVGAPGQDYRLLVEKKGKQPEQIELALEYAKAITRTPGQNSVSFQAPQAPVSRWRVTIPQAGVKVNLHPLIAATEVPGREEARRQGRQAGRRDGRAGLRRRCPTVRIDWTPKAEGATGLAAVASVQAEQQVWINEGVVRTRTHARLRDQPRRVGPTRDRRARRPEGGQRLRRQRAAMVGRARWKDEQRITAQLFEPAKNAQQVTVELEKFAGEKAKDTIDAPVVKAVGVGRQQGVVVVQVAEGLRAEAAKTSGLLQVDAEELPVGLQRAPWAFSYRYATVALRVGARRREGAAANHRRFVSIDS